MINNIFKNNKIKILAACFILAGVLTGCGISDGAGYTREELGNLAKLEIYDAENDTLVKTIEDEDTIYQYNQVFSEGADSSDTWEAEISEDYEEKERQLKESAETAEEAYYIIAYKYPAAKFGEKEPEKNFTLTLYQDVNIAKMTIAEESVKNISLPEEFLTFYFEMSEEEKEFYMLLTS